MGRRVSVDQSRAKSSSLGGDAPTESRINCAASKGSAGEPQDAVGTGVPPLRKPGASTSEDGLHSGVPRASSPFYAASASNSSSEPTSLGGSRDVRSVSRSSQIDRVDSSAKSLFSSTGRALRKHASKLSLASSISLDKDDEGKVVWKLSGLGAAEQESLHPPSSVRKEMLKRAISAPFGFQHVTHTYHEQVRGLERASRNELISEFSAIRAGQRADSHLRGIRAQSLVTESAPAAPDMAEAPAEALAANTNGASPTTAASAQPPLSPNGSITPSNVRCSRVVENFSRPVSRASSSPIAPPKRISSLNAFTPLLAVSENGPRTGANVPGPGTGTHTRPTTRPVLPPPSPQARSHASGPDVKAGAVGHAISTADDSARHLKASPLPMPPVDLEDVPEDDEEGVVPGDSRMSPVAPNNRSHRSGQAWSVPSSPSADPPNGLVSANLAGVLRQTTSFDEGRTQRSSANCLPGCPDTPSRKSPRDTSRFSIGLKPMCETQHWEDDVDYCYEHAAEAESDFDWDHQVANFPIGLMPSVADSSNPAEPSLGPLQQLVGLRKHDSQEGSILSVASSIADISASTNSIGSLPELEHSVNSSRESIDWELCQAGKRHTKPSRLSQPTSPTKSVKARQGLGLSYSLFPSSPRIP